MQGNIEQQKELKELLSRAEVKTMQKDLAVLREKEAEKEKERIIALKTEAETRIAKEKAEKIKREEEIRIKREELLRKAPEEKSGEVKIETEQGEAGKELKKEIFDSVGEETKAMWGKEEEERKRFLARVQAKATGQMPSPPPPQAKREELGTFIPKPPKRPLPIQKTLVRAIIILVVVFFAASFSFWFFFVRQMGTPSPAPAPAPAPSQPSASSTEEIFIPEPLIPIQKTQTLGASNTEEIKSSLAQIVSQKIEEDGFTRILFKDTNNNKILGLKEFFTAFEVKTPEGFLDKLNNDFTLFIFTSTSTSIGTSTNRLGFIAKIEDKEGIPELLTAWEQTVENDTEGLFSALGKKNPASFSSFRTAHYKGNIFRYISFPPANFGLCWAIINDRFLFTSSGESMIQLIGELTKQ